MRAQPPDPHASLLSRPARDWAVAAAANEVEVLHHPGSYLRYRMHVVDQKGDKVRDIIESRDGSVARLILRDGRPLTPQEDAAERSRLQDVLDSPSSFTRHIKNDDSGKTLADKMVRLLPQAMIYTYVPGQPQTPSPLTTQQIVLDYTPDPAFHPPTTSAEALTGLRGRLWIDSSTKQVVRMDGEIFRPVNFGWGVLAHVYPGGRLVLQQAPASGSRWIFTHFGEKVNVRALLVKNLALDNNFDTSNFQPIPAMSYQDAIHLLLNTPLPAH